MSKPVSFEKPPGIEYIYNSPQVPQPPLYRQQALNELIDRPAIPPAFLETLPDRNDKRVRIARRWIIVAAIILFLFFIAVVILSILLAFAKNSTRQISSDPSPLEGAQTVTQTTTQGTTYTATQTSWNTSTLLTTTTAWSTTSISASSSSSSSASFSTVTVSATTTIDPTYDVTTSTLDKTVSIAHTTRTTTLDASTDSTTDIVSTSTDIVSTGNPLVYKPTFLLTTAATLTSTDETSTSTTDSASEVPSSTTYRRNPQQPEASRQAQCDTDPLYLADEFCVMVNICNSTSADVKDNDCKNMCLPGLGLQLCDMDKDAHPKEYNCCNHCGCRGSKLAGGMAIGM